MTLFVTLIPGVGENELNGLAFRLPDDLALVLTKDKKLICLADYLHQIATVQGVAAVELVDHVLSPKKRQAKGDEAYVLSPSFPNLPDGGYVSW